MSHFVPTDRTSKQPATGYCFNPSCRNKSEDSRFEFEVDSDDKLQCPKCGRSEPPMVGLLTLIHLLVADPQGPVLGGGGSRWRFACDKGRSHLATATNLEAATGDVSSANCQGCLQALQEDDLKHLQVRRVRTS